MIQFNIFGKVCFVAIIVMLLIQLSHYLQEVPEVRRSLEREDIPNSK